MAIGAHPVSLGARIALHLVTDTTTPHVMINVLDTNTTRTRPNNQQHQKHSFIPERLVLPTTTDYLII